MTFLVQAWITFSLNWCWCHWRCTLFIDVWTMFSPRKGNRNYQSKSTAKRQLESGERYQRLVCFLEEISHFQWRCAHNREISIKMRKLYDAFTWQLINMNDSTNFLRESGYDENIVTFKFENIASQAVRHGIGLTSSIFVSYTSCLCDSVHSLRVSLLLYHREKANQINVLHFICVFHPSSVQLW